MSELHGSRHGRTPFGIKVHRMLAQRHYSVKAESDGFGRFRRTLVARQLSFRARHVYSATLLAESRRRNSTTPTLCHLSFMALEIRAGLPFAWSIAPDVILWT